MTKGKKPQETSSVTCRSFKNACILSCGALTARKPQFHLTSLISTEIHSELKWRETTSDTCHAANENTAGREQ